MPECTTHAATGTLGLTSAGGVLRLASIGAAPGVADAVTVCPCSHSMYLQCAHDLELVLWASSSKHVALLHKSPEGIRGQPVQLRSCEHDAVASNAQHAANGQGCEGVVACSQHITSHARRVSGVLASSGATTTNANSLSRHHTTEQSHQACTTCIGPGLLQPLPPSHTQQSCTFQARSL